MSVGWNSVSPAAQQAFLQKANLGELPSLSALNDAQWAVLTGIVGQETAKSLRTQAEKGSVSSPALDAPKTGDWSSIMAKVAELQMKLSELQINVSGEIIAGQKEDIAAATEDKLAALKESIEKLEKASKSGLFGKIFGWIGAIVGLVGAIAATVATGGAAWPAIAIAAVGIGMMVMQETGAMEKVVEFLAEKPGFLMAGLSLLGPIGIAAGATLLGLIESGTLEEDYAKMAVQVALSAAMLVVSIAGMAMSGGASAAAGWANVMKIAGVIGQILGGASSMGGGAAGIAQSVYSYQAAETQADMQEILAWLANLNSKMSEEMDRLQELIERLNSGVTDVSSMLKDIASSNRSVISNLSM